MESARKAAYPARRTPDPGSRRLGRAGAGDSIAYASVDVDGRDGGRAGAVEAGGGSTGDRDWRSRAGAEIYFYQQAAAAEAVGDAAPVTEAVEAGRARRADDALDGARRGVDLGDSIALRVRRHAALRNDRDVRAAADDRHDVAAR